MQELEKIEARLKAATPGPWMKDPDEPVHIMKPDKPGSSWDGTIIATLQRDDFGLFEEDNADLIANAPADIARLLAALKAVIELAEEWRYKGEFGWGAWQEGHGPDPEGFFLDNASTELRKTINEALEES